ncbi:glycosyltransferase family 2 protein [Kineococcus sp. SYSU DK006]|uniref:glycosyltransferase family 2 protein n=1 Tax=Kineococcus sp. SYSU DK006 TaxID=3383127 RepID=UPI003D7DF5B6
MPAPEDPHASSPSATAVRSARHRGPGAVPSRLPEREREEREDRYDYARYATLAGPFEPVPADRPYRVRFRRLVARDGRRGRVVLMAFAAIAFEALFLAWLLLPGHLPVDDGTWHHWLAVSLVVSIGAIELMRLVNVLTLTRATWLSADPVPVAPEPGSRVAFLTTIVPGKEPLEMAERTLAAARRVRHDGQFDVWLLDEGDDPDVIAMCRRLGVRHSSRKGIPEYNRPTGRNKARTKHGNYNAWLDEHGDGYDFWVSVDTDHVPLPDLAERLLGYFRDPDVAFVVGPQVYGNTGNLVSRLAESQQYLFHGVLQRAANRHGTAMFVGTNNAVRISALKDIDGLADSITEDAATSLVWHGRRNPGTGRRWKSVYTPDVLAVGEGPASWSDYFTQQHRWARGTDEVLLRQAWRFLPRLPAGRALHYLLLMSYYPSAALSLVLGTLNVVVYLTTGIGGLVVAANLWLMLYVNAAVLQVGIYFWNRRYNVSPHEEEGSSGISGMYVSVLSAPMYVSALVDAVRGRNVPFAVTPKGADGQRDHAATFRRNNAWGLLVLAALVTSFVLGHDEPAMRGWAVLSVVTAFLPMATWLAGRTAARWNGRRSPAAADGAPHAPGSIDLTAPEGAAGTPGPPVAVPAQTSHDIDWSTR